VLDLRLTESALNDYLQKLSLLDADGLSKELKDALQVVHELHQVLAQRYR
jgi:hypothetical protein